MGRNKPGRKSDIVAKSKCLMQFQQVCKEVDNLKTKVDECESNEKGKIIVYKDKLTALENKLENIYTELLSEEECEDNSEALMQYKDLILEMSVMLENKTATDNTREQKGIVHEEKLSQLKLPKFEIPFFYGDCESWLSFKELFNSSIRENKSLTDIEKLQYLQSYVRGGAAKLIRGFSLQSENLNNCWEVLCNRFENKRQLALTQINKIFAMKINNANDPKSFLNLIDTCNESIRNLKTLGLESNALSDLVFINFLSSKLDSAIRQRWELSLEGGDNIPDLDMFRNFLEKEAMGLGMTHGKTENKPIGSKRTELTSYKKQSVSHTTVSKENKCVACNQTQNHPLYKCYKFNHMAVNERWKLVKNKKLCPNCLRDNHNLDSCQIKMGCKNCLQRHHTLLHVYSVTPSNSNMEQASVSILNSVENVASKSSQNVLLATAIVQIKSHSGKFMQCRALLDNGSQNSLISVNCATKLGLSLVTTNHRLVGINGIKAETCLHSTEFSLAPYFSDNFQPIKALVVDRVTTPLPNFQLQRRAWPHTVSLLLADPNFYVSSEIDILIGADYFGALIEGAPIQGNYGEPSALPTTLGYILMGPTTAPSPQIEYNDSINCHALTLEQFFEVEAIPTPNQVLNHECESFFKTTTKRTPTGRYIVKLPFIEKVELGESANQALKVFHSMENKFQRNPQLKEDYSDFMEEYKTLGHMKGLSENDFDKKLVYYLPHHAVINNNSSTTKLRVVFNASAPSSNGQSLNSVLLKGPKLQSSIFSNLIQFRQFRIALSADITKMYRQILIAEEDTHFQRIFWRKAPDEPIQIYALQTVTYGTACAPFLALRVMKQLCEDEKENFPTAAKIAKTHFYIDDFLGGADSLDAANVLIDELQGLFQAGGFELRKWASNNNSILSKLPEPLKATSIVHDFSKDESQRILGLQWNCVQDSLQVLVSVSEKIKSKRQLLSVIARIFDPLGLLSPSIILLKVLLQEVWKAKLDWDETLPPDILEKWNTFESQINILKELNIPRFLNISSLAKIELHGFCDASPQAYAAVVYIKVISDSTHITLIAAKTRVAPVKPVTLPKLELCGALLLSELLQAIRDSLQCNPDVYLWTDSTITLSWIANPPAKGNQFVQHRVAKIHALTSISSWHHIPGKLNPADCATRGLYPHQLKENTSWWTGPSWLIDPSTYLTSAMLPVVTDSQRQTLIKASPVNSTSKVSHPILDKYSSYTKLLRVVAWIKRFIINTQSTNKIKGPLSTTELNNACKTVIKLLQQSAFAEELKLLQQKKPLTKSNKLLQLNVFLDDDGILRVGGRLRRHKTMQFDSKHPMLIPKNNNVTSGIINHYHIRSMHAGPELVLSLIREKFWIIDGRSAVKKELRKCIRCLRFSAQPTSQLMGDLPPARITPCRAFDQVGVDFAGPINTKCQHKRRYNVFKSYLCLFVCMCTKAVHLELVSDLTTASFLLALRRFISRRGCPTDIFSDNGRTFIGAAAYLKDLYAQLKSTTIQDFASQQNIRWHFMPPYGPNFGGLWESSIKLAKRHLYKTCLGTLFTFEELTTVLTLVEACINSRPLVPLSTDPTDLQALTPGHFLIGAPLLTLTESLCHTNNSLSLLSRWHLIAAARDQFWKNWSRSYLQTLNSRRKWTTQKPSIQVGQLVLLKEPSALPAQWKLGKITSVHPGPDNHVRVVQVRSAQGTFTRPITQLALLPDYHLPPGEVMDKRV